MKFILTTLAVILAFTLVDASNREAQIPAGTTYQDILTNAETKKRNRAATIYSKNPIGLAGNPGKAKMVETNPRTTVLR